MKGTTILLLGAATLVAYASAHPYSKIPESSLADKYNYRKTSSNSNSNSYSQSNHNEADVNGVYGGQTFSGSKSSGYSTNGGSHSQSSSFSSSSLSGNVPLGVYGLPGVSQTSTTYGEPSLTLGNPGTGGLGLSNGPDFAGSHTSSYGASNDESSNSGSFDQQITEGGQGASLAGSNAGVEIGSIESGLASGFGSQHSDSNSGIFGSAGGASFGQGGIQSGAFGGPESGYSGQADSRPGAVQYWWNGSNSPFQSSGKPSGGCNSNACSLAGTFDLNKASGGAHASLGGGEVGLNIHSANPFFNKGQGSSGSGFISTGASTGESTIGADSGSNFVSGSASGAGVSAGTGAGAGAGSGSKNPFFGGSYSGGTVGSGQHTGSESFAFSNAGAGSSSSGSSSSGSSGSSGSFNGAGNPFLKPGSGSAQIPQGFGQKPTAAPGSGFVDTSAGSRNPFFKPGPGSVVITPPVLNVHEQFDQGFPHPTPLPGFSVQSTVSLPTQQPILGFPSTSGYPESEGIFGSPESGVFQVQEGQIPSFPGQTVSIDSGSSSGDSQSQAGQIPSFPSQGTIIDFVSSSGDSQSQAGQIPSFPSQSTSGSEGFFISEQQPSGIDEGLTVSCSGQGRICVLENLCENGRFSGNEEGLEQVRTETQFCKVGREVCCTLNKYKSGSSSGFGQSGNYDQSQNTGSFGTFGQNQQTDSTGSYDQSQNTGSFGTFGQNQQTDSTGSYDQSQNTGSFGTFGQNQQTDSAGSYDQSQQQESFNFGSQSNSQASSSGSSSFGSRGESGLTQNIPSGFTSVTAGPNLITVTPGYGFRKPTVIGNTGGNSGFASASASASASADAAASGQASSGFSGNFINPSPTPLNGGIFGNTKTTGQSGGLFGSSDNSGEDLNAGEPSFGGSFSGLKGASASNGYLPPIGSEPSSNVPAFSNPPEEESGPSDVVIDRQPPPRPTFVPAPISVQVGCAAALICVEEKFCTLEGVISPEPVALTSAQIERRAPLSSCRNPDNGIIGKCCRDPNYVDPWPTGNLPANYTGGFDEQGFPTYLNISKVRPPKKQPPPTKGGFRQPTKGFGPPNPANKGLFEDIANYFRPKPDPKPVVSEPSEMAVPETDQSETNHGPVTFTPGTVTPTHSDETQDADKPRPPWNPFPGLPFPTLPALPSLPSLPHFEFPSLPNFELPSLPNLQFPGFSNPPAKPDGSKTYDSSATNESPTIIAPHVPGAQCGLRNKVLRPSGLGRDDVAFGEITWQAMVLSTKDRKLLCSGAIVAPNAVLTSAQCVTGFKSGEVSIKAGEWKLGYELKHEEPLPFEIVEVATIVPHPGFRPGSPSHDLAILFLAHPVALNPHVDTICLGDIPQPKPGRRCIATGWGKIVLQVNVAGSLMHGIDVDVLPQDTCIQRIQGAESQIEVDNSLTCVKAHNQWNNMCQVDFGGPLACDRGDGYYELTGVYSKDTGCLPTNQVATFALIDTNWVKQSLLSPPQLSIPNYEIELPNLGESPSSSNVQPNFGAQFKKPEATCDCQKSHLPPDLNRYLPPL